MKKSLGTSILNRAKTAREDRMVETASIKTTAMEDAAESPSISGGVISENLPPNTSTMEQMALSALSVLAKAIGGTVKNNCATKDYNGYKFCVKYVEATDSNVNFEFTVSKGDSVFVKFNQMSYCGGRDGRCRIDTYQIENAQRIGEQAYAIGFPIPQDLLISLNMIKLDLSKTNSKNYY